LRYDEKKKLVVELKELTSEIKFKPQDINDFLTENGTTPVREGSRIETLAGRPQLKLEQLLLLDKRSRNFLERTGKRSREIVESVEIAIKYQGYIDREKSLADKIRKLNKLEIPDDIVYEQLKSISTEGRQKLERYRPETVGMASRISGVSPSDVAVL